MTRRELVRVLVRRAARDPILRAVRRAAEETRARVWLVGGATRDAALGVAADDVDLVADRRCRALVRKLEADWSRRAFPTRKRGVTTWRFTLDGREVDLVEATRRGLLGDLKRRDFTINAVAFGLVEGEVADPLGGLGDLRRKVLRLPRPGVVGEDPVRALRAARFLAQLPGFRLDRAARRESVSAARALGRTPVERIRQELDRLLVSPAPTRGLEALERMRLLDALLPELVPLRACPAGGDRPDVWRHTLDAIARSERPGRLPGARSIADPEARLVLRWALLLHDVAKPETLALDRGRPTFHGHETIGARRADRILRRFREPRGLRRRVSRLVAMHLRPHQLAEAGAPERGMRRLVREAAGDLPLLVLHAACDALASGAPNARVRFARLRRSLVALLDLEREIRATSAVPLLNGGDVMRALGLAPGPRVGGILREVAELQLEGLLRTRDEALGYLETIRHREASPGAGG